MKKTYRTLFWMPEAVFITNDLGNVIHIKFSSESIQKTFERVYSLSNKLSHLRRRVANAIAFDFFSLFATYSIFFFFLFQFLWPHSSAAVSISVSNDGLTIHLAIFHVSFAFLGVIKNHFDQWGTAPFGSPPTMLCWGPPLARQSLVTCVTNRTISINWGIVTVNQLI